MKKQKQKEIKTTEFTNMVSQHKVKEVAPPSEAGRNMEGKYSIDRARAAQAWFKAAKEQEPSKGFLGVAQQEVDAKTAQDREMLYKGKKK
jgi:hypothetical protein